MSSQIKSVLMEHAERLKQGDSIELLISEIESLNLSELENLSEEELREVNSIVIDILGLIELRKRDIVDAVKNLTRKKEFLSAYRESKRK